MISAFTIIRNEEKYLQRMFDNISGYVDEIIVIDQESEDKSVEICKLNGAKVSQEFCVGYSEAYQEKAKSLCQHDWLLMIFPDEVWQNDALEKIREIGSKPVDENIAHAFRRIEYTDNIALKLDHPNYQVRLAPREYSKFSDLIHTSFLSSTKIKHHALALEHRKTLDDINKDEERFATVYEMLSLRYKYSRDPWIKMWMGCYEKELKRIHEGGPREGS